MAEPENSISFDADHVKRRLIRHVRGDMAAREPIGVFLAYFRENPETLFYDVVTDCLDYFGDSAWHQYEDYARDFANMVASSRYKPSEGHMKRKRSAVVSQDPMYEMLFRAVSQLFPQNEFKVFRTEAAAHAWLDLRNES